MSVKSKPIESDMLEVDTWYTFTVNPDDRRQYRNSKLKRVDRVRTYLINYHLMDLKQSAEFQLFPEFSNPWKQYYMKEGKRIRGENKITRLHYHGRIRFKNLLPWYSYIYNDLIKSCNIEIDTIQDAATWKAYQLKNKDKMLSMLQTNRSKYWIDSDNIKLIKSIDSRDIDELEHGIK